MPGLPAAGRPLSLTASGEAEGMWMRADVLGGTVTVSLNMPPSIRHSDAIRPRTESRLARAQVTSPTGSGRIRILL